MTHIYKLNDCDWVAAKSIEEARTFYKDMTGLPDDEAFDGEYELDDADIDRLMFSAHDEAHGSLTFRAALQKMLAAGDVAPFFFASTEE